MCDNLPVDCLSNDNNCSIDHVPRSRCKNPVEEISAADYEMMETENYVEIGRGQQPSNDTTSLLSGKTIVIMHYY